MNLFHPPIRFAAKIVTLAAVAIFLAACDRDKPAPQPEPTPSAAETAAVEAAPPPEGSVTIKLQFPQPFGIPGGYSRNLPNLTTLDPSAVAEEFHAPAGTQVVSEGKPVTASAAPVQGRLWMLTDGDNSSYPDALLVLPGGGQWVQIDLGDTVAIQKIHIWHAQNLGPDVYTNLVVQVSDDPQFQENAVTLYNADTDGSLGLGAGTNKPYIETNQGRLINGTGQRARYVRIWGSGSFNDKRLRFAEVQVYAVP